MYIASKEAKHTFPSHLFNVIFDYIDEICTDGARRKGQYVCYGFIYSFHLCYI